MKMRLEKYLDNNNIFCKYQYGFRKTSSTNLALTEALDEICSNLKDGLYGIGIHLDLQKAFDTVNPRSFPKRPYSRVRDLLAIFTLNNFSYC